ncbi:hypothetical protein ABPG74_009586 [Tetrahymena malaccensis]
MYRVFKFYRYNFLNNSKCKILINIFHNNQLQQKISLSIYVYAKLWKLLSTCVFLFLSSFLCLCVSLSFSDQDSAFYFTTFNKDERMPKNQWTQILESPYDEVNVLYKIVYLLDQFSCLLKREDYRQKKNQI